MNYNILHAMDEFEIEEVEHNGELKYIVYSSDYPITAVGESESEAVRKAEKAIERTNFPEENISTEHLNK